MKSMFVTFAIALVLPVAAQGQVSDQTCKDLANMVGSGYSTFLTQTRRDALNYYAKCESSDKSSKAGLDITYSGFGLGADYSDASKTQECTKSKATLSINDSDYAQVKQVFRAGLDVVSQCLVLASRGWDVRTRGYKDAVSLNIANTSSTGGRLNAVDIVGDGASTTTCKGLPKKYPAKIGQEGISALCTRVASQQLIDGTTNVQAEDVFINLQLADGPMAIPLPGYRSSALQGVGQEIDALKKQVADLQKSIGSLKSAHGAETYNPGAGYLNSGSAMCPPGSFVVSMISRTDGGGPHGIVSQVQPICRAVAINP
uniref:Uncharacterized protein n=1 Tax=Variovorax paradoxus (strain S110) TaxID=543728 RepID=C5CL45_VARPS